MTALTSCVRRHHVALCTITGTAKGCDSGSATVLVPAGAQWSLYESVDSPASASELSFSYLATPR